MTFTYDDMIHAAHAMQKYGGGFVSSLGECIFRADAHNKVRIQEAFPEYIKQYLDTYNSHMKESDESKTTGTD